MNLSEMRRYIQVRTGEESEETLVQELNLVAMEYWQETDPPGSVKEIYVQAGTSNIITLPPYVGHVKAIVRSTGKSVTLLSPRVRYTTETAYTDSLTWTKVGSSPLFHSLSGAGRVTAKVSAPNTRPFTVTLAGPDSRANHTVSTISFGANDLSGISLKSFSDIVNASKSANTETDVDLFDVTDTLVGTILSNQTRANCIALRVADPHLVITSSLPNIYQVLYKEHPIRFQVGVDISVPDELGLALSNLVSAELLSRSSKAGDQGRARAYENRAAKITANSVAQQGENTMQPINVRANPFVNTYSGRL